MTKNNRTTADREPVQKAKLEKQAVRDLEVTSTAGAVMGGRRKGGDPEEGGE